MGNFMEKKTKKLGLAIILLVVFSMVFASCPFFNTPDKVVPFIPVTDISIKQTATVVDFPMLIESTVTPDDASFQTINWEVESGAAEIIDGNLLYTTSPGLVSLVGTIPNGGGKGNDFTESFIITVSELFQAATDIIGLPTEAFVGVPLVLDLDVTVTPENATNQNITWDIRSGPAELIENNILIASDDGTVTVRAEIINGVDWGEDLIREFDIRVIQPVTGITDVPDAAFVKVPLPLTWTIIPADASSQEIEWEVIEGKIREAYCFYTCLAIPFCPV